MTKMSPAQEAQHDAEQRQAARRQTPETALIVDTLGDLLWNPEQPLSEERRERVELALIGYAADLGRVEHSARLALAALFEAEGDA